jgi:hypothetical protein
MSSTRNSKPQFLNLGCGSRYIDDWINLDFVARPPHVLGHDLSSGIPFEGPRFSFIYSSHFLEHFSKSDGNKILREMYRVLKPGGTVRVVVPDLEGLALNYIKTLTDARADPESRVNRANHEWANISILDQCSRHSGGGDMIEFLSSYEKSELSSVFDLEGTEIYKLFVYLSSEKQVGGEYTHRRVVSRSVLRRLAEFVDPVTWLNERDQTALLIGRFRLSGEVHLTMYDEISLGRALLNAGFSDLIRLNASDSRALSDWKNIHLDVEADGSVYKPLSLFMEARRA